MIDIRLKGKIIHIKIISTGKVVKFENSESATDFIKKVVIDCHTKKCNSMNHHSHIYKTIISKKEATTNE